MVILSIFFFITAIFYSSVGFGGGSTYLALLLIWKIPYYIFPIIALFCNIIVVTGSSINYIRTGNLNLKLLIPYLIGSIPFAFILTKIFLKKDIREIGSGNIGATNALRTGNKLVGYTTLILDIVKAIIPVIYVKMNYPELIYIASLCAFLGHVFPIWLKFKGGKGVATYVGILFSINILSLLA